MGVSIPLLLLAFVLIVVGALGFTNAVEWAGHKLKLGSGAVGALLAAVGTALPESLIPIIALISGGGENAELIAIGAVIGAPFLLATIAMLLVSLSAVGFQGRRSSGKRVTPHVRSTTRDLLVFLVAFPVAVAIGAIGLPLWLRVIVGVGFIVAYAVYAYRTVKGGGEAEGYEDLTALFFDPTKGDPPSVLQVVLQFLVSLAMIVAGAELFVGEVEALAETLGISVLVIALILAPLATELPEKANSVIWMRSGKDSLAFGNITGAMVFQATVPVALIMVLTEWSLDPNAIAAAVAAFLGALLTLFSIRGGHLGVARSAAWAGLFGAFVAYVAI